MGLLVYPVSLVEPASDLEGTEVLTFPLTNVHFFGLNNLLYLYNLFCSGKNQLKLKKKGWEGEDGFVLVITKGRHFQLQLRLDPETQSLGMWTLHLRDASLCVGFILRWAISTRWQKGCWPSQVGILKSLHL